MPRPTTEEIARFAEHVGSAHSWYKHFPLIGGGSFVCFLAPEHRALDYMWQLGPDDALWRRDRVETIELPEELARLAIRAYPFVVYDLDHDEWASFHGDAIAAIAGGEPHPYRDRIVAWAAHHVARRRLEARLSDDEQRVVGELAYGDEPWRDESGNDLQPLSQDQRAWLIEDGAIHEIRLDLQRRERARIASHIGDVLAWIG